MTDETALQLPTRWQDYGWTAQVLKNEDDDGWAVAMTKDGASEPALVGPWTMGRDKKNPKPLDRTAFSVLYKTVTEFVGRQEQQRYAALNPSVTVNLQGQLVTVTLHITADDDNPSAKLVARDAADEVLGSTPVEAGFRLTRASALRFVDEGFVV